MLYHISNPNASIQKLSKLTSWCLHLLTSFASLLSLETQSEVEPVDTPSPKISPRSRIISFSINVSGFAVISHHHTHKLLLRYNLTRVVFNCRIAWPNQPWRWPVLKSLPGLTAMKAGSRTATGCQLNQFKIHTYSVGLNRTL